MGVTFQMFQGFGVMIVASRLTPEQYQTCFNSELLISDAYRDNKEWFILSLQESKILFDQRFPDGINSEDPKSIELMNIGYLIPASVIKRPTTESDETVWERAMTIISEIEGWETLRDVLDNQEASFAGDLIAMYYI